MLRNQARDELGVIIVVFVERQPVSKLLVVSISEEWKYRSVGEPIRRGGDVMPNNKGLPIRSPRSGNGLSWVPSSKVARISV